MSDERHYVVTCALGDAYDDVDVLVMAETRAAAEASALQALNFENDGKRSWKVAWTQTLDAWQQGRHG